MLYPGSAYPYSRDGPFRSIDLAMSRRASLCMDHGIYQITQHGEKQVDHDKSSVKTYQTLHLLRHAACLEALVSALEKDKTHEEILGAQVDSRVVQKLFVVTATSLFSIFGQIMRKLVLSSEA